MVAVHTSSPVCKTVLDAVSWQLSRAGRSENIIALDAGVDDLNDDVAVGKANDEAVLGCVTEKTILTPVLQDVLGIGTYYLFFAWVTRRLRA